MSEIDTRFVSNNTGEVRVHIPATTAMPKPVRQALDTALDARATAVQAQGGLDTAKLASGPERRKREEEVRDLQNESVALLRQAQAAAAEHADAWKTAESRAYTRALADYGKTVQAAIDALQNARQAAAVHQMLTGQPGRLDTHGIRNDLTAQLASCTAALTQVLERQLPDTLEP